MDNSKFDHFEKVKILPKSNKTQRLIGTSGIVLGKVEDPNTGTWYYSVSCDSDKGYVKHFYEYELESLGTFVKREDYYSGDSVTVGVTKDGKGYIKVYKSASDNKKNG